MPHGEEFSNTIQVKVDGVTLPADILPLLVGGYVDDSTNVPDMFLLRFTDTAGTVLPKGGFKIGSRVEISVQTTDPSGPKPLLTGDVTALEVEVGEKGLHTVVRGLDLSHRLFRGTRTEAYLDMTASDIARKVAQRAGLTAKTDTTSQVLRHVTQGGVNDWDFLRRLGAEHDRVVTLSEGKLEFTRRTPATEASGATSARANPLVLEAGSNLVHLRGTLTAGGQVPQVEVRGWDPKHKQVVTTTQQAATESAKPDSGISPRSLAAKFESAPYVLGLATLEEPDGARAIANSLADHLAGGFAELEGTARGNPRLRAGTAVIVSGVGPEFTGKYVLTSTRHEFSPGSGYQTAFSASNTSERSLYGATSASTHERPRVAGVVPALVTNIKDPDQLGRVKVKLPWLSESYESQWARTVHAGAGGKRGAVALPEVNDEVLVAFAQGDLERPYVLGGLYNGVDTPHLDWPAHIDGSTGAVKRRAFVSRTGMVVEMLESAGAESVVVSTNGGTQKIVLDQTKKSVEILSEGKMTLKAKQGIELDGGAGDVKVKGLNVEVTGTSVKVEASAQVAVKGAVAELSASGPTTVKGAIVRIN